VRAARASSCAAVLAGTAPAAAALTGARAEAGAVPALAPGASAEYLLGIVLVMLALGAFAVILRRLQGRAGAGRGALRVRAALALGGRERLLIVEAEGERLLLGVGAGGVRLLRCLGPSGAGPDATPGPAPAPAQDWLARTLGREGRA